MSYRYDLFVSYRRSYERNGRRHETAVGAWVKQVFYPCLCELWNEEHPGGAVFLDEESIPAGAQWPPYLMEAMRDSECLVPVWSPPYFDSRWCCAEWQSMTAREELFKIDRAHGPGLVVPVVFHDGDSFPDPAKNTEHHDFHDLSHLRAGEPGLAALRMRLRDLLIPSLREARKVAPPWHDDFPLVPVAPHDIERPVPFHGMVPP